MPIRLPIVLHPHPTLTTRATSVDVFDAALATTVENMVCTMQAAEGVGLAANQVNLLQRIFIIDFPILNNYTPVPVPLPITAFINPEVVEQSSETYLHKGEGCLSVPDVFADVERPNHITVQYQDVQGASHTLKLTGLAAAAVLHEMDHLSGILFPQRVSRLKRQLLDTKYRKKRTEFLQKPWYPVLTTERGVVS